MRSMAFGATTTEGGATAMQTLLKRCPLGDFSASSPNCRRKLLFCEADPWTHPTPPRWQFSHAFFMPKILICAHSLALQTFSERSKRLVHTHFQKWVASRRLTWLSKFTLGARAGIQVFCWFWAGKPCTSKYGQFPYVFKYSWSISLSSAIFHIMNQLQMLQNDFIACWLTQAKLKVVILNLNSPYSLMSALHPAEPGDPLLSSFRASQVTGT